MKKPIIPISRVDDKTIDALIRLGYLYVDENGIHAKESKTKKKNY